MGQLLITIAPFLGIKKPDGLPVGLGDFFPSLAPRVVDRGPDNLRILRGREQDHDTAVVQAWDRWAKISRAVASGKRRVS